MVLGSIGVVWYVVTVGRVAHDTIGTEEVYSTFVASPEEVSYAVEGKEIKLTDGAWSGTTDDAMPVTVQVRGDATLALDVNDDGIEDTVVVLARYLAGENPTYYLAVALSAGEEGYIGSEAYAIGTEEPTLKSLHDLVAIETTRTVKNADTDDVYKKETRYFSYHTTGFFEIGPFAEDVSIFSGHLSSEDGSGLTFRSCGGSVYAVDSESPSYVAVEAIYTHRVVAGMAQGRVFAVLAGKTQELVEEVPALTVLGVLSANEQGVCPNNAMNVVEDGDMPMETPVDASTTVPEPLLF